MHTVTVVNVPANEEGMYDDEGNPVQGETTTEVPALWVEKTQIVSGPDGNSSIVAYVTCYLPPDMTVGIGATITNERTGRSGTVVQVRPPIDEKDKSLPFTAWLE